MSGVFQKAVSWRRRRVSLYFRVITVDQPLAELVVETALRVVRGGFSFRPYHRIKHGGGPGKTFFFSLIYPGQTDCKQTNKSILPDSFGVTFKKEDGDKLHDILYLLQVINGIIQVSLPVLIKVDQSRST